MDRSQLSTVTQTIDGPCPICGDPAMTVENSLGGKCLTLTCSTCHLRWTRWSAASAVDWSIRNSKLAATFPRD